MTGYQETLTDPSYAGQIVVMTAPHIGNTGVNGEDDESRRIWVAGYVVRDPARRPANWRATGSRFVVPYRLAQAAEAYLKAGFGEAASALIADALRAVEQDEEGDALALREVVRDEEGEACRELPIAPDVEVAHVEIGR